MDAVCRPRYITTSDGGIIGRNESHGPVNRLPGNGTIRGAPMTIHADGWEL